jgi:rod shape determining protein RodA
MRDLGGHRGRGLAKSVDWSLVICYLLLITIGWVNIYASIHSTEPASIFDWSCRSGKQAVWIGTSFVLAGIILFALNPRIYEGLSTPIYIMTLGLLVAVIFLGIEVKGSRSWFEFGPIRFQPAEVSKISTSLMLATVMSQLGYRIGRMRDFIITAIIILVPMMIIVLQSETGSALVYVGFIFMLYREGLSGWLIFIAGMAILLFILTLTASPFVAILVLVGVTSLCVCLYSGRLRLWLFVCVPMIVLMAFVPMILETLALKFPEVPFLLKIKPLYILLGTIGIAIPIVTYLAFREGNTFSHLATLSLIAGVILVFSADFIFNSVLQDHQRKRIEVLLGMKEDPTGVGYNVNQSMIAIGSGGFSGKGFLIRLQSSTD